MELLFELNKMCTRFPGAVTQAIRNTVLEEQNENAKKILFSAINSMNEIVKIFDGIFEGFRDEEIDSLYVNKYLEVINIYYCLCTGNSFFSKYSQKYWGEINKLVLSIWKDSNFDEKQKDDLFIRAFNDLLGNALLSQPEVCERKLSDFQNMYRATKYKVNDAYNYIMPDPDYCNDNRWNDDGVAFLYLAYDNEDGVYRNIKVAEKTCFEECRTIEGTEIAICKFVSKNDSAKIMYLAYQDVDYDLLLAELNQKAKPVSDKIMQVISEKTRTKNKLNQYAKSGREDLFKRELKKIMDNAGINDQIKRTVENYLFITLLGNICDSVFYAVDKEEDPELEAYIPFRKFSKYLIHLGYAGVAFRSTRMEKIGLRGTNLVLFNPNNAEPIKGTMKVYKYHKTDECELLKEY